MSRRTIRHRFLLRADALIVIAFLWILRREIIDLSSLTVGRRETAQNVLHFAAVNISAHPAVIVARDKTDAATTGAEKNGHGFDATLRRFVTWPNGTIAHVSSSDAIIDPIVPIFRCESSPNKPRANKLVFVHVFKTAGSTLRLLLGKYALWCHAGWSLVVGCTYLDVHSIDHGEWRRTNGDYCNHKLQVTRDGKARLFERSEDRRLSGGFLRTHTDILGGHFPLGVGDVWESSGSIRGENDTERDDKTKSGIAAADGRPNMQRKHPHTRYVAFFRDAAEKYVSGVVYSSKSKDQETIIRKIKDRVSSERAKGKYDQRYLSYLITPDQWDAYDNRGVGRPKNAAEYAAQIMSNLVEYGVIVGMTDRMSESLELIQRLIDHEGQMDLLFEKFGMMAKGGVATAGNETTSKPLKTNVSPLSTTSILNELKRDGSFYEQLLEYVKYEQQITDFARSLHLLQYESIQNSPTN